MVPNEFVMFSCSVCPPVRFSITDAPLASIRVVAGEPRRVLRGNVPALREAQACPDSGKPRVVVGRVLVFFKAGVVVVVVSLDEIDSVRAGHKCRRGIQRQAVTECAGHRHRDAGLPIHAEVVQSLDRPGHRHRHRQRTALSKRIPARECLDSLAEQGTMDPRVEAVRDRVPVFETDDRPSIDGEQVRGELAEAAAPQVCCEPMGQTEIPLVPDQRLRRRQVDQVQIDFRPESGRGNGNPADPAERFEPRREERSRGLCSRRAAGNGTARRLDHRFARRVAIPVPRGSAPFPA